MAPVRIDLTRPQALFDTAATRRLERAAAAQWPAHTLMQRAGLATARLALALAPHARTVWIACGPGNNGGDGLEAAVHLQQWGKRPIVGWLGDETNAPVDARASLDRVRAAGVRFEAAPPLLGRQDLAVDALFGIGNLRAPDGRLRAWLHALRGTEAICLNVDLPTGLLADTGAYAEGFEPDQRDGHSPGPRHTLSLLTAKLGLFTAHGQDAAGTVWFDDLGCAPRDEPPTARLNGAPPAIARPHASHKGTFGDVAVVGGAHGMAGALLLAGSAALHHGAGRVYLAPLDDAMTPLDWAQPELMFRAPNALPLESSTVVCGCGGGTKQVAAVLPDLLRRAARLVLDADALNAISADASLQAAVRQRAVRAQPTVLTPHPLEAARLLQSEPKMLQRDRLAAARSLAERFNCTAVLKGSGSLIAAPGRTPVINPTGNARLATAGTGDVLAGMVGAHLAARHADANAAWDAACAAVYLHGRIADEWPDGRPLTAGLLAKAG